MGSLTLSKIDRLYWMGRYTERVNTTVRFLMDYYDKLIDGNPMPHEEFCKRLSLPDVYTSDACFLYHYVYDRDNADSLRIAADRMLGNGMTLRETIGSNTLSYLQLAVNNLDSSEDSDCPMIYAQQMLDDLMAFRGSFDDNIEEESIRDIIKCGLQTERVSLYLRLGYPDGICQKEIGKLLARVRKTPVRTNSAAFSQLLLTQANGDGSALPDNRSKLIEAAETLIEI